MHYTISYYDKGGEWYAKYNSTTLLDAKKKAKEYAKSQKVRTKVDKIDLVAVFDKDGMSTLDKRR